MILSYLGGALASVLLCMILGLMSDAFAACLNQLVSFQTSADSTASWITTIEDVVMEIVVGGAERGIMEYLCGIGLAIAMAYFAIAIIQMAMEDKLTPEQMLKAGAKLVISVCVIMWSPDILEAMFDFGRAFAKMFGDARFHDISVPISGKVQVAQYSSGSIVGFKTMNFTVGHFDLNDAIDTFFGTYNAIIRAVGLIPGINLGASLGVFMWCLLNIALMMIISALVIPIINLCVMFIKLTRIIELGVRGSLMPIAAGLMADDGWRGAGGRYVRKLLALCIQLGIVNLTMAITGIMMQAVMVYSLAGGIVTVLYQANYYKYGRCSEIVDVPGIITTLSGMCSGDFGTCVLIIEQLGLGGLNAALGTICVAIAGIGFMFKSLRVAEDLCGV